MSDETIAPPSPRTPRDQSAAKTLTREELFELVWREPMLRIAEKMGVSSSYMSRVCTELRVPRPSRGYWAKLEHGQSPHRPPLPPAEPGDPTIWQPGRLPTSTQPFVFKSALPGSAKSQKTKRPHPDAKHALVDGARAHFVIGRQSDEGLLKPNKKLLVDIVVSEVLLDNALNSANILFQALEARGHRVLLAAHNSPMRRAEVDERESPMKNSYHRAVWSPFRPTLTYVDGVPIGLTLFEMTEEVAVKYVNGDYIPLQTLTPIQMQRYTGHRYWNTTKSMASGRLCLQAYSPHWQVSWVKQWRESKPEQMATIVKKIVSDLEEAAPTIARQIEEAERNAAEQRRKWEEEREQHRLEAARAKREKARIDARSDLLAAISEWDETRRIHAYFDSVEREANQLDENERALLLSRINEARELIGPLNALAILKSWKTPAERI